MNHIYNQARFNQSSDFSNVTLWGSDIDYFSEVAERAYIAVEWKCAGQALPRGQELGFGRLVNDLGKVKPSFLVVAEHNTHPDDPIHGDNSYVVSVRYRLPNMYKSEEYRYGEDVPTLNQWLSDFSLHYLIPHRMHRGTPHFWEGFPQQLVSDEEANTYKYIEDVPRRYPDGGPKGFFDYTRTVRDAYLGPVVV